MRIAEISEIADEYSAEHSAAVAMVSMAHLTAAMVETSPSMCLTRRRTVDNCRRTVTGCRGRR